ncbi:transcription initiation protein SPT3 homolog isoform X2 [Acanthaster planci]|uniref:Transcription initiation protein SPT3 homolog isoform X2 n=1 Tax=Acanthaster planci TaxID=133434 RepID=A0A8B7YED5_ACAPL|nr:transcription initiation protein SPT3 homolog isoform X2 [Acanthaster planci]
MDDGVKGSVCYSDKVLLNWTCHLYALGDCRRPQLESAELIEDILRQQLISLLQRAADVCYMRNARFISIEDFIFLMRHDRDKLRRLLQFLHHRDQRQKLAKMMGTSGEDEELTPGDLDQKAFCRRQKISYDFLSTIDQSGELLSLLDNDEADPVKMERLERAEMRTRYMDSNTYKEFTEARQVNFSKKGSKFKEWLDYSSLEPKPNPFALEIMQYLAYETVAQLVELSFIVRRDMAAAPWDPLTKTSAPLCSNNLPSPGPFLGKSKPSPSSTPLQSPTSSPTSPNGKMVSPFLSSSGAGGAAMNVSLNSNSSDGSFQAQGDSKTSGHGGGLSKSKSKRKKKPSGSSLLALVQYRSIKPLHVREAYRRLQESSTPMAAFCKYTSHADKVKYLAC